MKNNQPKLHAAIGEYFTQTYEDDTLPFRQHRTRSKSRGREEERVYRIAPLPESMCHFKKDGKGLRRIGQAITRTTRGGKPTSEVRYFICSIEAKGKLFADAVRSHWGIENGLDWVLDVVFGEDSRRIRQGHARENFAFLRRFVTTLLRQDTSKSSLKAKRKRAGWNPRFLEKLLFQRVI